MKKGEIKIWTHGNGIQEPLIPIPQQLTHTKDRIIIKMDMEYKNSWTFEDGTKIRLERRFDNFDEKYTRPINAWVISADGIPEGVEILCHHNATHDTNRIFNYQLLSGEVEASDIKYFSIREDEAFAWYDEENKMWMPIKGFDFALHVFKPYKGILEGIEPTPIKNVLWVTTGEFKNNVCYTLLASNYKIIFQDRNGREGNVIRFRSEDNPKNQRECEIVLLHHEYTEKVLSGEYIVGVTISDAKPLNEYICQ